MAAMEILAWTIFVLALAYQYWRRDFRILKANGTLILVMLALIAAVAVSLLVNLALKPFLFQFGFMRFVLVLWGLVCEL